MRQKPVVRTKGRKRRKEIKNNVGRRIYSLSKDKFGENEKEISMTEASHLINLKVMELSLRKIEFE